MDTVGHAGLFGTLNVESDDYPARGVAFMPRRRRVWEVGAQRSSSSRQQEAAEQQAEAGGRETAEKDSRQQQHKSTNSQA